jgi:aminoglycoside phosphotransferase (APT) family kinase protein
MNRTQIYLEHEDRDSAAWRAQWREALEKSAGIAPYLDEGSEYVEDIRRADAERLSRLAHHGDW